jgi:hypothetical protein
LMLMLVLVLICCERKTLLFHWNSTYKRIKRAPGIGKRWVRHGLGWIRTDTWGGHVTNN